MLRITDKHRKEYVKLKLSTDPIWITRALVLLYNKQTGSEKMKEETTEHNGFGFRTIDAGVLCRFAKMWLNDIDKSENMLVRYNLIFDYTCKKVLIKTIPRYWRQIIDLSDKKELDISILRHEIELLKKG
jgi:hypothetical protein